MSIAYLNIQHCLYCKNVYTTFIAIVKIATWLNTELHRKLIAYYYYYYYYYFNGLVY